jgi:hypothetical protein
VIRVGEISIPKASGMDHLDDVGTILLENLGDGFGISNICCYVGILGQ